MFCRFGSLLLRRPVAATAWLKLVCTRPVSGLTSSGSASMYVPFSFIIPRQSRISLGSSWVSASSSSTSTAVDGARDVPGPLEDGQAHSIEQHLRQLLRRVDVELAAGQLVDPLHQAVQLEVDLPRLDRQRRRVDAHAGLLDGHEHRDQRQLQAIGTPRSAAPCRAARGESARAAPQGRPARTRSRGPPPPGMSPIDSALTPLPQTSSSVSAL